MKYILFIVLFLCSTLPVAAQGTSLKGLILDRDLKEPLPGVHVFLNQTTIGTITDSEGRFELTNVPPGDHVLIASMIGFKRISIRLSRVLKKDGEIKLEMDPIVLKLDEITVTAEKPKEWLKNLRIFEEQMIGISRNARKTRIINPEVLEFDDNDVRLLATAPVPLEIENRALGYHITFHLKEFIFIDGRISTDGFSEYRELTPQNSLEESQWEIERNRAYNGSFTHFIHSLFSDQLTQEGFLVYYSQDQDMFRYPVKDKDLVRSPREIYRQGRDLSIIELYNNKSPLLRVDYVVERPEVKILRRMGLRSGFPQHSWIRIPRDKALIDIRYGKEVEGYRSILSGYWGFTSRIADLLPKDYKTHNF